jgi:tripartite-type tricarboxylate transporter receptor subunit TctC
MDRRTLLALCALGAFTLCVQPVTAQTPHWPQRTVRFILPLGPGSGVDIGARLIAEKLSVK